MTLSSTKPSWQMIWHGLKAYILSLKHRPLPSVASHEASVASRSCDWLLLDLAMRERGAPLTKKIGAACTPPAHA